jgi:hypothetical protein
MEYSVPPARLPPLTEAPLSDPAVHRSEHRFSTPHTDVPVIVAVGVHGDDDALVRYIEAKNRTTALSGLGIE